MEEIPSSAPAFTHAGLERALEAGRRALENGGSTDSAAAGDAERVTLDPSNLRALIMATSFVLQCWSTPRSLGQEQSDASGVSKSCPDSSLALAGGNLLRLRRGVAGASSQTVGDKGGSVCLNVNGASANRHDASGGARSVRSASSTRMGTPTTAKGGGIAVSLAAASSSGSAASEVALRGGTVAPSLMLPSTAAAAATARKPIAASFSSSASAESHCVAPSACAVSGVTDLASSLAATERQLVSAQSEATNLRESVARAEKEVAQKERQATSRLEEMQALREQHTRESMETRERADAAQRREDKLRSQLESALSLLGSCEDNAAAAARQEVWLSEDAARRQCKGTSERAMEGVEAALSAVLHAEQLAERMHDEASVAQLGMESQITLASDVTDALPMTSFADPVEVSDALAAERACGLGLSALDARQEVAPIAMSEDSEEKPPVVGDGSVATPAAEKTTLPATSPLMAQAVGTATPDAEHSDVPAAKRLRPTGGEESQTHGKHEGGVAAVAEVIARSLTPPAPVASNAASGPPKAPTQQSAPMTSEISPSAPVTPPNLFPPPAPPPGSGLTWIKARQLEPKSPPLPKRAPGSESGVSAATAQVQVKAGPTDAVPPPPPAPPAVTPKSGGSVQSAHGPFRELLATAGAGGALQTPVPPPPPPAPVR